MGDRLLAGKPSRYVTGHLGQLSLPSLLGTVLSCWGEGGVCSHGSGSR